MVNDDNVSKLYKAMANSGYDVADLGGSEDSFREAMKDADTRKAFYDWAKQNERNGFRIGEYDEYEQRLGGQQPAPTVQEQSKAVTPVPAATPDAASTEQKVAEQERHMATVPTARDLDLEESTPLTEQDKAQMMANTEQMKQQTQHSLDAFNSRMDDMKEYREGAKLNFGHTVEGKAQYNPESGKMEKTYITPTGERHTDKALADVESFRFREAADVSAAGQLFKARRRLAEIDAKLAKRGEEVEREQEQKQKDMPLIARLGNNMAKGGIAGVPTYAKDNNGRFTDEEYRVLQLSRRKLEEEIQLLENAQQKEQHGERFLHDFFRNTGQAIADIDAWDFGFNSLMDASTSMALAQKAEKGEELTEVENDAMYELFMHNNVMQQFGDLGTGAKWGDIAGTSLSFMKDFLLTGGFGGVSTKLATKIPTSIATKAATRLGTNAAESLGMKLAKEGLFKTIRTGGKGVVAKLLAEQGLWGTTKIAATRALGVTLEDLLVRAPLMAATVQGQNTAAEIINTKYGPVIADKETGELRFTDDKGWGDAAWQTTADKVIENFSEMWGGHLPGISDLTRAFGARNLTAAILRATRPGAGTVLSKTAEFLGKAGINGYLGEVGEEYYGQLWRTMLNLDAAKDNEGNNLFKSREFHADIWGGMAMSIGLTGGGTMAMNYVGKYAGKGMDAVKYLHLKHMVDKSSVKASEVFTPEVWDSMRMMIDAADNADVCSIAAQVMTDKEMSDEQRAAAMEYMERSLVMRGYNLGEYARRKSGETPSAEAEDLNQCYINGYNIAAPQEMNDAKNMLDYQRQRVSALVDEDMLAFIDSNPVNAIAEVQAGEVYEGWVIDAVLDYLNAKQVYDGMLQRVRDDIDSRVEQSNAMVDTHINRSTGMVQGATMKTDDRRVYVVAGNLVQYDDGSGIDLSASDFTVIVRDAATGKLEQASSDAILNIDKPLDPSVEKEAAAEAIRQQMAQAAANNIDGVASFNEGDTYTITDENGAQAQVAVVPNEQGIIDNGDGTVNVSDGAKVFPIAKDVIQEQVNAANIARVAQFEVQRAVENAPVEAEQSMPQYERNDNVTFTDENGNVVNAAIEEVDADGVLLAVENEQTGMWNTKRYTTEELAPMVQSISRDGNVLWSKPVEVSVPANEEVARVFINGREIEKPHEWLAEARAQAGVQPNVSSSEITNNSNAEVLSPVELTAMERIPKDEQGAPIYEQADSDTAWDAIVEQTEGDEVMAQTVADGMVSDKEAALKKLEKAKAKDGVTIAEKIAAEKERKAAIDAAKQELAKWQEIAGTANRRKMQAEAEAKRVADEAAAQRKAEEERLRAEREEAERMEREALNGVPDMVDDTPQDARARGYRRVNGHKIDRQEPVAALQGKEIEVKFGNNVLPKGRVAVIEAEQLQPSHVQGVRNPLHFIDEAQPKERNDEASVMSAQKIAGNIRPEEITSSVTAYTGAPTVNSRGEVIQGNSRSDALRLMWNSHQEQAAKYKQYLMDHAEEFGLNAADIEAMQNPVLVNMLDVEDAEAITLGQYVAQDTESGGVERIKPKNALQKMGANIRSFANLLLKSGNDDASFAELVDANGVEVLIWMATKGYITPTQYQSAFDSKGNLTAEAKNDLRGIMYQSIFKGGSTRLEEMFNAMPAKAQKAILATAFRDYDSPSAERMMQEIQDSIRAFHALSQSADFASAKNFKNARKAVDAWKMQYQIDDATGESYLPADNFSNFALLLATMYKGENQNIIQGTFNKIYDLVQGTQEKTLFEQPDNTPRTLAQAINETLNITYDGQHGSDVLAGDSAAGQRGQQGSTDDAATGERIEDGERTADSAGGVEAESRTVGEAVHQPQSERKGLEQTLDGEREADSTGMADDATREVLGASNRGDLRVFEEGLDAERRRNTDDSERTRRTAESERLVNIAKQHGMYIPAEVTKTLTGKVPKRTGESVVYIDKEAGKVTKVKDPYAKSAMKSGVQPEDAAFEHLVHNLLFPETEYTFEGISESMGDVRIVLSQKYIPTYGQPTKEQIAEALAARGLFPEDNYSFGNELVSVTDVGGDNVLLGEDGTLYFIDPIIRFKKPLREIISTLGGGQEHTPTIGEQVQAAEAEVNTTPTDKQKEAGNYNKGHVQIGTFNVTIEQPRGSVRSGVDKGGKKWEVEMQNTYGYIRGTEGVDGDHIDVFLSNDIDGWNGRQVYVIDQRNADGSFDEHKVMLGFNDINDAEAAYLSNYEQGWQGLGAITGVAIEDFEKWIASSHRKTKAFAEYKSVKTTEGQSVSADKDLRRKLADFNVGDVVRDYYDHKLYRIKKHSTNGVSTIAELDAEGNEVGTSTMNAHNNARYSLAEAPVKAETTSTDAPYSIAPAQYTTKKGKVLDMHLVKFNGELTKEQQRAAKELAKADKGWYDREQGGFMMRSEESAKQLADTILNNEDAVSEAQPVSMADVKALNNGDVLFTEPKQAESGPTWQYSVHVESDGYTTLRRDDVSGAVPVSDGWQYSANSPEEMLDILRNPHNGTQEVLEAVGVTLENKIKTRELDRKAKEEREQKRAELRANGVNGFKIGDKVVYTPASGTRKAINATIHDFEEYGDNKPVLDVSMAPVMYEIAEWSDIQSDTSSKTIFSSAFKDLVSEDGKYNIRITKVDGAKRIVTADLNTANVGGEGLVLSFKEMTDILNSGNWQEKIVSEPKNNTTKVYHGGDKVFSLKHNANKDIYMAHHKGDTVEYLFTDGTKANADEVQDVLPEPKNEGQFGLVSDSRMAELKERLRKKLGGQMNIGIDPEILAIGLELAVGHLDRGIKTFTDFAKVMVEDLGDVIRPYLKAFYNGARELPEVQENGLADEMTPYDEVQKFDVANFDKTGIDAIATAETVTRETEVEKEVEVAQERIKKSRSTVIESIESPFQTWYNRAGDNYNEANKEWEGGNSGYTFAVFFKNWLAKKYGANTTNVHLERAVRSFLNDNESVTVEKNNAEQHRKFAMAVKEDMLAALDNGTKPYRSIVDLRKRASALGMEVDNEGRTDILLQELVEDGLVRAAREVIERNGSDSRESYDLICKLYEMQPTIAARSSNRIKMQQYSTPLPMAWIANRFAMEGKADGKVLEPTAGNGMLVFTVPVEQVHANELDETRLDNLREQGFAQVTQQDATVPFEGGMQYDVVIANPPFGKREAAEYDGKLIPGLDPQITLNALSSMKDDGRAAIIIGGNMEYASNGAIKSMKPFFTYLYDHYNVSGVIDMGGSLYAKQGTTYPTRMILINGRRSEEERAQTAIYPPVESKAIRKAETFDDLYEIINEVLNSKEKTNGTEILRSRQGQLVSVDNNTPGNTDGARRREQPRKNDDGGKRGGESERDTNASEQVLSGEHRANTTNGEAGAATARDNAGGSRGVSVADVQRVGTERVPADGVGLKPTTTEHKKRSLTDEKSAYRPHNTAFSLESVAPAAMVEAMDKVLTQIEEKHGSIDEFIRTELGYDTVEEAHQALAAEQMDSVAMAIYQMKQGQALIIGDQTGVGKGRQMAALIRWAVRRGEKPVFITQKADLFSDIYRDLVDIGSGDLVPFIFNSDGAMVDSNGNTIHKPLSSTEMAKVFASGVLPDKYDFAVLTYSQVNTGDAVSQKELEEAAKKSGARAKKSKAAKEGKATPKATFLRAIAKDNYLFLDESHTAAGSSNTGAYLQSILRGAKAATFASATFAKRPDTMPLYAIRTAMSQAKVQPDEMIAIIEKGGVTLQEIMSRELTNAGQMVRRERDMSDVVTDWKTITDPETVRRARENYDRTIAAFNAIVKFQEEYVKPKIEAMDKEIAEMAQSAGVKKGTDKMGVENVPFASKTYNYTKQLMLALKVDAIADEVEAEINAGRHPVIALESTMESSIKDYAAGEVIDEPTFSASLLRGLDTVMQYTVKDENGKERHARYTPESLGAAGAKAYYELQDFIRESTSGIFISPLDAIIERLHEKGYKVGELTGRNMYVERDDNGQIVAKRRTDKDKKRMQREFNSGELDVLILNKSASTGISLHASEKFSDQRQRSMIIAQPLSDINDYMQMIGRIDRTGQVHRGYYINLGLPVPAEGRFLMMLSTKLKSLNANTTTSQDSESNDVEAPDLLNKYGSQVVVEYLRDNLDIYDKLGAPFKGGNGNIQASQLEEYKPQEDDARKITGYVALLTTKEQEDFYNDVVRRYNELINYLNDTGSNDLKINVMPLRAKTIEKRVSSEGIDPNGNNPFARNSYVEKVEMDVLRKPMKADDIRKVIEQINKGVEPKEHVAEVIATVEAETQAKIDAENERYEKAKEKVKTDIARFAEKVFAQQKRTDEEKREAIARFADEARALAEQKHNQYLERINANSEQLQRRLGMFEAGKSYLVPDNLDAMAFDFTSPAIFCGYKAKDSKVTASTTLAVFATLDGRRRIEVKLSQIIPLQNIEKVTNDNWDAARYTTLENWDSQIPAETRKVGYIMTGNILQAIADTQDEHGGYPGQLISYTDMDGNIHDGILMPDKWNASMLKSSGAPISSRLQQIKEYQTVTSHDGKVVIAGNSWTKRFTLTVPRTKKEGAVYFENKTLLRAAGGNFYPYRGQLRADILANDIEDVVKELTKLGVKVKSEVENDTLYRNDEYRSGNGAYTDDALAMENDPVSKALGKSRMTSKQRKEIAERERQRMVERVEDLAKKLHLDNVEVVTDSNRLDGKKRTAKGFYSKSTGKITIVIPNHSSVTDAVKTLLHEAVAHHGLRKLFGEHFDTFLDNVFNNADEAIRREIVDLAAKNGWDFRKATEEYLAMLAEDTNFENARRTGWWGKIKRMFLDMLHKIGFDGFDHVVLTDNELRYILWRSYENLAEPGARRSILGEAADIAKQYELKVGNYAENVNNSNVAEESSAEYNNAVKLSKWFNSRHKGAAPVVVIQSEDSLEEQFAEMDFSQDEIDSIVEMYKKSASAFYDTDRNIVVLLRTNLENKHIKSILWHEAVHTVIKEMGITDKQLDYFFELQSEEEQAFTKEFLRNAGYDESEFAEEYLAYYIQDLYESNKINYTDYDLLSRISENADEKYVKQFEFVQPLINNIVNGTFGFYKPGNETGRGRDGERGNSPRSTNFGGENRAINGILLHNPASETNAEGKEEGVAEDDVLFRSGDPEIHERVAARDRYERRVKSGMFQSQEALQDSMLGLKEAMEAILGKGTNIEDVDGFENAYLGENRLSSVNKAEADAFAHTLFKPMLDAVAKLAKNDKQRNELTDYMMAKHGLERNAYMRNEALSNGDKNADKRDFAGLTALTGMDDVADAEAEAQQMVDDYEQAHDTADLWEKVNAVSKAILQKSYDCGMMSKETFDKVSDMYGFYIPLRGFDEKTSADAYAYLDGKRGLFNAPIRKAEGRKSKADDPFANLEAMAESAIMQGNRNKLVKQRFLNFALNHPSDLVSVRFLWLQHDDVTNEWKPVFPDNIDSNDTPEDVERKMQEFEDKMEALAEKEPDKYKRGKDAVGIPYRVLPGTMKEHQVIVKRNGRDYVITINGNPRAAQALNGQTNPDNDMSGAIGAILRAGEKINRQLSAFYTTRNPDFIVSNFVRDMLYTNTMAWVKESPNYAWRFHKNYLLVNPAKMKRMLARYRKGTLDMNDKTDAMFYQFMMNGGETGYANIRDIEQHKNDIRKELKRTNGKLKIGKVFSLLAERFDELNRAVENCARFAAFVTSRELGRSIDRAIYDAKEISVNFNKKGSGAKFLNATGQTRAGNASAFVSGLGRSGFVFWNAAVQGSTNFGRQLKRHPAKALTGMAAMFLLGAIVAYLGGDDDEDDKNAYYNLPEYVRRSNILFRAGDSWISIPLPIEYRAMYGMGELMTSVLSGKEHLTGGEIAEAIASQMTQILPIDFLEGGGGWKAFMPSAAKPIVEAYVAEKSWTGMPLYKDTPYNKDMPEWTKAYKSANKYIVGLAAALNEATGGDQYTKGSIDFNPAKVEYMLNGYFGGVSGTIDKMVKMGETWFGDREYDPRSFLMWNRLVKAGDERTEYRAVNNEYFRLKEEHDQVKTRLRNYERDTDNGVFDFAEKIDFLYNSPEYLRYEIFEDYQRDIEDLNDELKEAVDDDERKDIETELNELKKEMIKEINLTRGRK